MKNRCNPQSVLASSTGSRFLFGSFSSVRTDSERMLAKEQILFSMSRPLLEEICYPGSKQDLKSHMYFVSAEYAFFVYKMTDLNKRFHFTKVLWGKIAPLVSNAGHRTNHVASKLVQYCFNF